MATQEQIDIILKAFKKAPPAQILQRIDVSAAGIRAILIYLAEVDQTVTAGMISEHMHVSTARVAVLLKKLEARGLIEKERDPQDARRVMVKLSAQGREHMDRVFERIRQNIEIIIDTIGAERLMTFVEISGEIQSIIIPPDEIDC